MVKTKLEMAMAIVQEILKIPPKDQFYWKVHMLSTRYSKKDLEEIYKLVLRVRETRAELLKILNK